MYDNTRMSLQRHLRNYAVVGVLQWAIEYTVMLVLSQYLLGTAFANLIGRICGASMGYWLNGKWTFSGSGQQLSKRAATRFLVMWLSMTGLNTAIVTLIDHYYGLPAAQLFKPCADLFTAGIGFLLSRHWVYRG